MQRLKIVQPLVDTGGGGSMTEMPTPDYDGGSKGLRRSRNDRMILGVCGGIAEYYNIDSAIVRIVMFLFGLSIIGIIGYIVIGLVIPEE
ncbi:MAG: PspC domain-containing protein [Candidatus Thorarchaeota archaeon]